jgi:hypothetical protein
MPDTREHPTATAASVIVTNAHVVGNGHRLKAERNARWSSHR